MAQAGQEFHKNDKNLSPIYAEQFGITKAVLTLQ